METDEPTVEVPARIGPNRVITTIGHGGMGKVFMGRTPGGRKIAIKVIRPDLAQDPDFRRRFAREVQAASRVSGAFTAPVVSADAHGPQPWLATAYVAGIALEQAVRDHGPWPLRCVRALAAGLVEALSAIHSAGVVHRDLKPSNVLLTTDGPRVIDFGISAVVDASRLTATGTRMGTPGFMSPEQHTDGKSIGPASDVFSLGVLLAYTATGANPFGSATTADILGYRIVHEEPDLEALPADLRQLLGRCLAKDPAARPALAELATAFLDPVDDVQTVLATSAWLPPAVARITALRAEQHATPVDSAASAAEGVATVPGPPAAGRHATTVPDASAATTPGPRSGTRRRWWIAAAPVTLGLTALAGWLLPAALLDDGDGSEKQPLAIGSPNPGQSEPAAERRPTTSSPAPKPKVSATDTDAPAADPGPKPKPAPSTASSSSPASELPDWDCRAAGFKYPTHYGYGLLPCIRAVDGTIQYTVRVQVKVARKLTVHYWLGRYEKNVSPYEPAGTRHSCTLTMTPGQEQSCPVQMLDPSPGDYMTATTVDPDSYDGVYSEVRHWSGRDLTAADLS